MSRVAVLGLGRMGAPMAAKLVRAGHDVTVWNRGEAGYRRLAEELELAPGPGTSSQADSPAQAVADVDVVITMFADGAALESVLFGPGGVAAAVGKDTVICDMATIGVDAALACARRLAESGIAFLDAPVSGSVPTVRAAGLLVMVGGPAHAAQSVEPVLRAFAKQVLPVGGNGSGQAMKLAVNSVVHSLNASLSEAIVLAEHGGVARETVLDVLAGSVVAAPYLLYKRAAYEDPAGQPVAFTVDLMRKDLDLIREFAASRDCAVPVALAVHDVSDAASAAGFGGHDMSAIAEHHRTAGGVIR
jgi:3-hydroxyisobutyrate dehydrogenase-like beta-hydroxyacid dehydrogenase